jgi:hypothetical protein
VTSLHVEMRLPRAVLLVAVMSWSTFGQTYTISTIAGNGMLGFSGDNGPATSAELYGPGGVAVDSAGNLYIADSQNYRIRKVSNGVITTVAGNGVQGYSGDNGPATSAEISVPLGVAVDSAGNLYIADAFNMYSIYDNRIRKVTDGVITTVAGSGNYGFSGDNGPATSAELDAPNGIALDSAGNLYIADTYNNRIRKVTDGVIITIAGNGTLGFSGENGPATSAGLDDPYGVAVDSAGNLYIAAYENNLIRVLTPPGASSVTSGASNLSGPIAPGEIVVVYGSSLGPSQLVAATVGSDGSLRYATGWDHSVVQWCTCPHDLHVGDAGRRNSALRSHRRNRAGGRDVPGPDLGRILCAHRRLGARTVYVECHRAGAGSRRQSGQFD